MERVLHLKTLISNPRRPRPTGRRSGRPCMSAVEQLLFHTYVGIYLHMVYTGYRSLFKHKYSKFYTYNMKVLVKKNLPITLIWHKVEIPDWKAVISRNVHSMDWISESYEIESVGVGWRTSIKVRLDSMAVDHFTSLCVQPCASKTRKKKWDVHFILIAEFVWLPIRFCHIIQTYSQRISVARMPLRTISHIAYCTCQRVTV